MAGHKKIRLQYFLGVWLLISQAVVAQQPIRFQNITVNEGLSMGTITAFAEDANGFIWIATAEGLHRYDGKYLKVLKHVDGKQNSLSDSYITSLVAVDNQLFIGNNSGIVDIYNTSTLEFEHIQISNQDSLFDHPINTIVPHNNYLYINTLGGGIWKFNITSKELKKVKLDGKLSQNAKLVEVNKKLFLISGYTIHSYSQSYIAEIFIADYPITTLAYYKSKYLVGTQRGLYTTNFTGPVSQVSLPPRKRLIRISRISNILVDGETAWIGTLGGLLELQNGSINHYQNNALRPFSLVNNNVTTLFLDQNNILWTGTISGISKYAPHLRKFGLLQYFDYQGTTINNNVYCTYQDNKKDIWLGTLSSGLIKLDAQNNIKSVFPEMSDGPYSSRAVRSILQDRKGRYWVGTRDAGLFSFNSLNGRSKLIANVSNGKLKSNVVRCIYEDDTGSLWIGTQKGLHKMDGTKEFDYFVAEQNSNNNSIYQITPHPNKKELILATFRGGLQFFNPQTQQFKVFKHNPNDSNSLTNNNLMSLCWINSDTLLIGTYGGGLNILDLKNNHFSHITEANGLINNAVYGILYEGNGITWLSTNNGLIRYNIYDHQFINFGTQHYLQSSEFNEGAFLKTADHKFYFGGVNGLNFFYPNSLAFSSKPSPSYYTDIRGVYEKKGNSVKMDFLDSRLEIDYMCLDYSNAQGVRYEYKLDGYDKEWIANSSSNTAVYPRLSPGTYTFNVRASDEFDQWKSYTEPLKIYVEPPLWQKWWFVLLLTLFAIGLIYVLFQYRTREIKRTYKLQLVDSELTAIRSQMNPHFIFNSLNSIQYYILKKQPKEAYSYLSKFASLIRKILQNSRLKYISVNDEIEWLNLYLEMERMRMDNNLYYAITHEGIDDLGATFIPTMLIQPFVENSIVHGLLPKDYDRKLEITLTKKKDHLDCTIKDNGIGRQASRLINAKRSRKHKSAGMQLTEKRLKILSEGKGEYSVNIKDLYDNEAPTGTLVTISLPLLDNEAAATT